ncbi:AsmA family protein [Shewanella sedimentimangrovi]|uniref:AsmA family protein n=1 Tax=Shewanella sedimentimangrovi TaxID=2814293 RepID=A0ABX7R7R2_9GAMM|nr:AsmA family protein [Shewanella sedimentimangrovi]QSX38795.1 AsmA family protein [Shewanella sedimentimangrovi]
MKFFKWLAIGFVVVLATLVAYVTLIFDLNDFKPRIVDQVKKQTGREFTIADPLGWTFFPSIGIKLGGISLGNPQGFTPADMVRIDAAVAEVKLLPLLSKEVEIAEVRVEGLEVNLVTLKNGASSLDGLTGGAEETKSADTGDTGTLSLEKFDIGGVTIENARINIRDDSADSESKLALESFRLGQFSLGSFADFSYRFQADLGDMTASSDGKGQLLLSKDMAQLQIKEFTQEQLLKGAALPKGELSVSSKSALTAQLKDKSLKLILEELNIGDISAKGQLGANYGAKVPSLSLDLEVGDLDVDAWLPATSEAEAKAEEAKVKAEEPDLRGMKAVDLTADIKVSKVKVMGVSSSNWLLKASLKGGVLNISSMTADLYQGKLKASASIDGRKPVASYNFEKVVEGVQLLPLLKDAADVELLAGTAHIEVKGKGYSLLPDNIKRNLLANGSFDVADGALYGVNIPQMIRSAEAKLKGGTEAAPEERKTDFSKLSGSLNIKDGVANNPDLSMLSPLVRLSGSGNAKLVEQEIDYRLMTRLVATLEGQGGDSALSGVDIPLAITGSFQDPKFALDTQALFDAKLKQEADKAKDKLKDKLKDSLLKKLGGN